MTENTRRDEALAAEGQTILPLVEERLHVGVREVETGRVRVSTVSLAHEEMVRAELLHVDIEIERVPIGREIDAVPDVRTENGTIIVPVVEEVLVTTTRLMLVEEVHLHRRERREPYDEAVTLRRQHAVIERLSGRDATPANPQPPT